MRRVEVKILGAKPRMRKDILKIDGQIIVVIFKIPVVDSYLKDS
jgi:hypothetical protein